MVRSHLMPIIIAGPTASGKSSLAMKWALEHNGEIICADSRQFYQGMSIGTACPTKEDQEKIVHHGYGMIDPLKQKIDAGFFVDFAHKTIAQVQQKQKRPILVGGTGLYVRALYYGISDVPPSDKTVVDHLNKRADEEGLVSLFEHLKTIDPKSAENILPNDRYRIIRALEIYELTQKKPSDLRIGFKKRAAQISAHWIYKKPAKEALMPVLERRVIAMYESGLVEEAMMLRKRLPKGHWALSNMGYEEALLYADQKISKEEAIEKTFIRHRQYAKRQYAWFNKELFYRFIVQ